MHSQRLETSLAHELALLPRMLQSIELLQLPCAELEAWLLAAAQENAALEVELREPERPEPEARPRAGRVDRARTDRHAAWLEEQPARPRGWVEELESQLALCDLDPPTRAWASLIVRSLDANGFLASDDAALLALGRAEGIEGGERELARALAAVRSLEPRGIGARNAVEALILQLDPNDPDYADLRRLLGEFLGELAKNKLPAVARAMHLELSDLGRLLERLRELEPCPAAGLQGERAAPIVPDVVVERDGDGFEVRIEGAGLAAARVDPKIELLARDRGQPSDVRRYLRDKLARARWIVGALEQRQRTLQRIARALFARQIAFLEHGPGHLAPLKMRDLARELSLNVSTVSRAVAQKHAATPWGTFALRHFFQAPAPQGGGAARDDVREIVRRAFAAEDPAHPLADDEVCAQLAAQGVSIARRTVAKYRRELGLASSYRRRRF